MFTPRECRLLSAPYFRLVRQTDTFYEIQSQNTGHFWIIKKTQITQKIPLLFTTNIPKIHLIIINTATPGTSSLHCSRSKAMTCTR